VKDVLEEVVEGAVEVQPGGEHARNNGHKRAG